MTATLTTAETEVQVGIPKNQFKLNNNFFTNQLLAVLLLLLLTVLNMLCVNCQFMLMLLSLNGRIWDLTASALELCVLFHIDKWNND